MTKDFDVERYYLSVLALIIGSWANLSTHGGNIGGDNDIRVKGNLIGLLCHCLFLLILNFH